MHTLRNKINIKMKSENTIDFLKNNRSNNFFLLAGPCVIEGEGMAMDIAGAIKEITDRL